MQFRNVALATLVTSATALGAFADETISDAGTTYEDAAKVSGQYVYDRDTYEVNGQTFTNVGGEVRSESTATRDEDSDTQMGDASQISGENIVAAAEQGTLVSTSDDIVVGSVAYTQEMDNGYRVFVTMEETHDIGAEMIGFSADVLEVKTVGEGLEYGATLQDLKEHVDDKT